jgi:hypothetical protein
MSCGYPCPSHAQHTHHPKRASDMRQGWTTPGTGRFGARLASENPRYGNGQCLGCCLRSGISRICRQADAVTHVSRYVIADFQTGCIFELCLQAGVHLSVLSNGRSAQPHFDNPNVTSEQDSGLVFPTEDTPSRAFHRTTSAD